MICPVKLIERYILTNFRQEVGRAIRDIIYEPAVEAVGTVGKSERERRLFQALWKRWENCF